LRLGRAILTFDFRPMLWSTADIADAVYAGLMAHARGEDLEQAVYGLDSRDELGLHPLIHGALRDAGYGVWPERRYPVAWGRGRKSEGKRCDVVLTPAPAGLPLRDTDVKGTLFDSQPAVDPDEAYWLEVKTVAQFEASEPFGRYSSELFSPVSDDVRKLWLDPVIAYAGLLLVLFTLDQAVSEHDLAAWHERCLQKSLPVTPPAVRGFALNNRVGNAWCAVALFGVRGG
jgi:hypothetical protein